MKVTNKSEAWAKVNKIFPTDYEKDEGSSQRAGYDIYRHPTLNYYTRICDLGNRLEVLTGEYGETVTNIWIVAEEEPEAAEQSEATDATIVKKNTPHHAVIHYTERNGNKQYALQCLAADILNNGKRLDECHHVSQEFHPNGEQRTIMTGSYCIAVLNELTGTRELADIADAVQCISSEAADGFGDNEVDFAFFAVANHLHKIGAFFRRGTGNPLVSVCQDKTKKIRRFLCKLFASTPSKALKAAFEGHRACKSSRHSYQNGVSARCI